jgi:hypothetical protein
VVSKKAAEFDWVPDSVTSAEFSFAVTAARDFMRQFSDAGIREELWAIAIACSADVMMTLPEDNHLDDDVRRFAAERFAVVADALRQAVH